MRRAIIDFHITPKNEKKKIYKTTNLKITLNLQISGNTVVHGTCLLQISEIVLQFENQ